MGIDPKEKLTIRIPKWGKHQHKMKGKKTTRDWVAISTRLVHDPDFFNLTIEQRYLWLMLLCHAGAVGVEYEWGEDDVGVLFDLSASDARVLFKLRRSADFQPFINQGLIEIESKKTPLHNSTEHNKTEKKQKKKPDAAKAASPPSRFDDFWNAYPKKVAKKAAASAWKKHNAKADQIIADVQRRKVGHRGWLDDGGKYIPNPATYLNQERWTDEIEPPKATPRKLPTDDAGLLKLAQELKVPTRGKSTWQLKKDIEARLN